MLKVTSTPVVYRRPVDAASGDFADAKEASTVVAVVEGRASVEVRWGCGADGRRCVGRR